MVRLFCHCVSELPGPFEVAHVEAIKDATSDPILRDHDVPFAVSDDGPASHELSAAVRLDFER